MTVHIDDGFRERSTHPTRYRTVAVRVMTEVPVAVGPFPVA
ncbi:MAG TPA: hypothetical protein VE865_00835 [Bradyrhizobium sp.]|nr:hypothetical protein [Bradyrhizobium sp.]